MGTASKENPSPNPIEVCQLQNELEGPGAWAGKVNRADFAPPEASEYSLA